MPRSDTVPVRRRVVRARPRLPRGPKPASAGSPRPQSNEHASASPPISEPSPPNPSDATIPFDRNKSKTLSVKEAAFLLNKSEDTVYSWLRAGRLRGWQLGGRRCSVLVSEESVELALLGAAEMGSMPCSTKQQ